MFNDIGLAPPEFWIVALAAVGLAIGSFLNVVIYRVPRDESIVLPASHCGSCGVAIKPYDNVPLVSYAVLGGKCRACRARISPRYPLVEALTAALYVGAYLAGARGGELFVDCVFVTFVVPLVFIDADEMLLPSVITHPGLLFALVARGLVPNVYGVDPEPYGVGWMVGLGESPAWYASLAGAAAGGALGGGLLLLLGWLWKVIRGRWGMGLGDVSMMCFVGAFLGWPLTILTIVCASFAGSVFGIAVAVSRRESLQIALPFGVFLGIGAVVSLLFGHAIVDWYLTPVRGY